MFHLLENNFIKRKNIDLHKMNNMTKEKNEKKKKKKKNI